MMIMKILKWEIPWIFLLTFFVGFAVANEHDILETGLQCSQCGCGADGAANLNDVYAEKCRKLSTKKY